MNKLTEKQRVHFQRKLEGRVNKLDRNSILDKYHVEYFYHPDFSFGKLFKNGTDKVLVEAFNEAYDNSMKITLLVFSRPRDNMYAVICDPLCCPFPGLWFDDLGSGSFMLCRIEDFLEEA